MGDYHSLEGQKESSHRGSRGSRGSLVPALVGLSQAQGEDSGSAHLLDCGGRGPAKGRTSAFHVLVVVRKIAAIAIGLGMRLIVVWIPSELNSADYPSRHPGVFSVDEASGKRLRT